MGACQLHKGMFWGACAGAKRQAKAEAAARFWRANVLGEVRKNGEMRLGRERFGIMGGHGCHTKELGLYPLGNGEPWEDQGVRG